MNRWSAPALLLIIGVAIALRIPQLDTRPLHNDEAVNAVKVAELWQHGRYRYDPDEYHGPALHYATVPFIAASGAGNPDELGNATLRIAPVVFGIGLILLLLLFADGLGIHAIAWAAIFTAVSPAMVFYSRYFIHEMLLVFFTALTLGAGWRYVQTRWAARHGRAALSSARGEPSTSLAASRRAEDSLALPAAGWAVLVGVGLGLMFATKETFVLTLAAMGLAGVATISWAMPKGSRVQGLIALWNWKHAALALGTAFIVWLLFFSSFFTNFAGLLDSVRTYLPWLKRAGGHSPHIHPWSFYLQRLAWFHPVAGPVWSEGLILFLAAVGAVVSLAGKKSALLRFLALYTMVLTAIYSAISYKTPWCLLNFYLGMILLAGVGAAALVEFFRALSLKVVITAIILVFTAQLAGQARRANFDYAADRRNPYVYAQTVPDLLNLVQRSEALARVAPMGYE